MEESANAFRFEDANYTTVVNGPAYATAILIEIILAAITNLFVLIFTICHPKTLKQPSIIFLTNFILANLVMTFIYMPTIVITGIELEWIFGRTTREKIATCEFVAFILTHVVGTQSFTLTAISVDRFLFIVKPLIHRQYMKTWVAVLVSILTWIASCIISIPPLFGFGEYSFVIFQFTCVQFWHVEGVYVALALAVLLACVIVIIVTSIWTYCFTHKYIRRTQQTTARYNEMASDTVSVYDTQLLKIIGIFGTMLLVTVITYVPGFIGMVVTIITYDGIPDEAYSTIAFLFYTITISNPIIQSYFRKDLKDFVVKKAPNCTSRACCKVQQETA